MISHPIPNNLLPLLEQFPEDIQKKIITGWSQSRSIVSFRANNLLSTRAEIIQALTEASLPFTIWDIWEDAFTLPIEYTYALKGLDIYTEGKIYVQSLSSMVPALCLDLKPGQKILDMAAAPGSKTTQIGSMLRGKCSIIALEKFGVRLEKLVHTIKLQGASEYVEVIKMDAIDFAKTEIAKFDRILLDAPCSSDGRINLTEEKTYTWYSEEKSKIKAEIQFKMLESAGKLLSPTGRIVYSTCSLSRGENEKVIKQFLRKYPDFETRESLITGDYSLPEYENIHSLRYLPTHLREGFFVCILSKRA